MSQAVAKAAAKLDPAVELLAEVGHVRSVEVDDKGDRIEAVIRVRMERPLSRGGAKRQPAGGG